mmetsp:Transcript_20044/g.35609  ORF Transcript_20044/g.35609 Transcript_20044/m.35609 type:complete len:331 (-) Transcript_20044:91-1083(-)
MKSVVRTPMKASKREFKTDASMPEKPGKGQVTVQTKAAGLNPVDYKIPALLTWGKPVGMDMAGVVTAIGPDVTQFKEGDRVFGCRWGTLSEYSNYPVSAIAKIPDGLSYDKAGAMPTAYLTAYQAFAEHGFKEGMTVLVLGASGGTGIAGVQVAKAMKAGKIIGVCSGKNREFVLKNGGDQVIDYKKETVTEALGENSVDFVLDCASGSGGGEDYFEAGKKVLKNGPEKGQGFFVALNSPNPVRSFLAKFLGLQGDKFDLILTKHSGKDLDAIVDLMKQNESKEDFAFGEFAFEPELGKKVPFTEQGVEEGYEELKSRRARGKVVVEFGT